MNEQTEKIINEWYYVLQTIKMKFLLSQKKNLTSLEEKLIKKYFINIEWLPVYKPRDSKGRFVKRK